MPKIQSDHRSGSAGSGDLTLWELADPDASAPPSGASVTPMASRAGRANAVSPMPEAMSKGCSQTFRAIVRSSLLPMAI